jgi:uncharacterized membrane protein
MRTRLLYYWDSLQTSYWFVPTLLNVLAAIVAVGMISLDHQIQDAARQTDVWWIYGGGPEGARAVMSTIAGSMITVAGVVFSITIVALSLASGQFGPRILRNFIRDRSNQVVLGTFTGTFIYCLLVLRTILGVDDGQFVPGAAVALGIILALLSLGVLVYFIHHVSISIQAHQIVAAVSREMHETIDRLWPDPLKDIQHDGDDAEHDGLPEKFEQTAGRVPSRHGGYIAALDVDRLVSNCKDRDLVMRLAVRPGQFVIAGSPLALVAPDAAVDDDLIRCVNEAFLFESQRTPYQDIEFTVDQMVEVAVRALSPGINDPFTAIVCVDWLAEALGRLAGRSIPSPRRLDDDGTLRVVTRAVTFADVADAAFNQIRQYGSGSASVMIRLLEALARVAYVAGRPEDQAAIIRHAHLVRRACERDLPEVDDRNDVLERYNEVLRVLDVNET